ncbi:methyltransferase [Streptomyces sp. rh34]|uniref:methyltransferase n=1 Tax=Streptomyces sp. rh34 TaxID=2034272 RepID=UPI000BEF5417|nr:methyltransferase [Streptomyces sp. rh34]
MTTGIGQEREKNMEYDLGGEVAEWMLSRTGAPHGARSTTTLMGLQWDVFPGVWHPNPGTRLFTSWLPIADGCRLLEVGCAAGVTCVVAARGGCTRVVGVDIYPAATDNTRRNAARHGVAGRVEALTSDLFAELDEDDVFDVICSNPPLAKAPESRRIDTATEQMVYDPGYELHRRFFREVGPHLADDGRIYVLTSETLADPAELRTLAAEAGFSGRVHASEAIGIPASVMGSTPAVVAAADEHGVVRVDFTMLEFQRG